mgnify:CR=1 FL=1
MRPILIIVILACFSLRAVAQPSADDFMPPVMGGTVEVKAPDQVKVDGNIVSAASAQDAMNAAVTQNKKDLRGGDTPEVGAMMVKFPSCLLYTSDAADE